MDVTRKNFKELLPMIEDSIRTSDFISIDAEFTGLLDNQVLNAFDYPWEYYSKIRNGGMNFLVIQFGLCAFHYNNMSNRYTHKAFNFYIYPHTNGRSGFDTNFLCQSSSMEFLAGNGFDFNKLFKEGIPYVNFLAEQKLKENFDVQKKSRELRRAELAVPGSDGSITVPEKFTLYLKDICDQVHRFIKSPEKKLELGFDTNGYIRKLIFHTLQKNFNQDNLFVEGGIKEGGGSNDHIVVVTKEEGNREEILDRRDQEWCRAMIEDMDMAVGFSTVMRMITDSGKLVVGHNMFLDVCHCLHQFCADLPQEYEDFKSLVHCVFPRLIDTKLMSSMYPFKDKFLTTGLLQVLKRLSEEPFEVPDVAHADENSGYKLDDEKAHEAGYDAYVTGICFISLCNYLDMLKQGTKKGPASESPLLKPFENRLYLMKVQDIPYLDLLGKDVSPPRDHVFYVTFPPSWNLLNLRSLFRPFGQIYVSWLNQSSAFVALEEREKAALVSKTLLGTRVGSDSYTVQPFLEYHGRKNGQDGNHGKSLSKNKQRGDFPPYAVRSNDCSEVTTQVSACMKRKRSLGESSFSKRSIDPIPEEMEDDVDKHSTTPEIPKEGSRKVKLRKVSKERKSSEKEHSDMEETDCAGVSLGKERGVSEESESGSQSPTHTRAKRTKRKEFDENESWD